MCFCGIVLGNMECYSRPILVSKQNMWRVNLEPLDDSGVQGSCASTSPDRENIELLVDV